MDRPNITEKVALPKVRNFAEGNVVVGRKGKVFCGDGREPEAETEGGLRLFGADYGKMLAIKGAFWAKTGIGLDDQKLIDAHQEAVRSERGEDPKIFVHTDDHNQKISGIGCGHIRLSCDPENEGEYVLPSSQASSLYHAILARPDVDVQVLEGEHEELAVLLVYSEKNEEGKRFSVNSKDREGKSSYFVVDMDGIKDHLEIIVPQISNAMGIDLTAEEVMRVYEKQQNASAEGLAKHLDKYRVDIDSHGQAKVEKI